MMRAVFREVQSNLVTLRQQAAAGCAFADLLRESLDPTEVNGVQEWLGGRLREVEARIQTVHDRRKRRKTHLHPRLERKPELRKLMGGHLKLLESREEALQRRRDLLRHIGDTAAWLVCGEEPRILAALFDASKTHHVPTDVGAIGHRFVRRRAHESGDFYVIENDFTRCLGKGDLTVIPCDAVGTHRVYPLELKTEGEAKVGEFAFTHVHAMLAEEDPIDREYVDRFVDAVGLEPADESKSDERAARQRNEIGKGRKTVWELLSRLSGGISSPPPQSNLPSIKTVIDRAVMNGIAWDVPEKGIGYVALNTLANLDERRLDRQVERPMRSAGLGLGQEDVITASTAHVLSRAEFAVSVRPIPLWSLPFEQRGRLLAGEIVLETRFRTESLKEALEDQGITICRGSKGHWELKPPNGPPLGLDMIGNAELTARITFEGVGPRAFASHIAAAIDNPESE